MLSTTFELINLAASSSLLVFFLCNLIIVILLVGSSRSSSFFLVPPPKVATSNKNAGIMTDPHTVDKRYVVTDAREGYGVKKALIHGNIEDQRKGDDEEDDELRERVEEFIDKVNRGNSVSRKYFLDFVERVLLLHDASDIRRFRLDFNVPVRASRVNSWVKHNLQELDLSLPLRASFILPCCLFTCESLVVLDIVMDCALKVPTSVCLPKLKCLHLSLPTFLDDNSPQRLFSSCPVLEDLALVDCGWQNTKRITISVPSLRSLTFRKLPSVYMNEDLLDCEFRIHAANLFAINFMSNLTVDCLLLTPSSLKNASIDLLNQRAGRHEVAIRAIRLLNCIQNVKSLRISGDALMSLECADNLPSRLPTFYNLTTLEVDSDTSNYRVGVLIDFLQNTPNLEFLDIELFMSSKAYNLAIYAIRGTFFDRATVIEAKNLCGKEHVLGEKCSKVLASQKATFEAFDDPSRKFLPPLLRPPGFNLLCLPSLPAKSGTVIVDKEFSDRWEVDRYLSASGYLGENTRPFFVALPKERTTVPNDEFWRQISQVDAEVLCHLRDGVKGGYDEEKYRSYIGFGCLRDYLESELQKRYKEAAPATLALLEQRCSEVTAELTRMDGKIEETSDVAHLRRSAMLHAASVCSHMVR
ncbi:hypothetical protein RJ640_004310 [Escallonia rubra]|uniref:At1g61320/AtMIF1 LRR domain-containing protein n=1 Tax=Escallonia rubra TaxID=112253 RepID=A0AA88USC1_9ASTE|nr:hypothetical protein RJ640_004310 [Escallonia rubra]